MKYRLGHSLFFAFLLSSSILAVDPAFGDCTGCCSGHGGVVCVGGVTKCGDGTALSATCVAKGCNKCPTPSAPTVTTNSATSITSNSAVLNGLVNPNGASTTCHFDYGTSTSYGSSTADTSAGSGTTNFPASATVTGLSANTTYHYRLVASNTAGTSYGSDVTFTSSVTPATNPTGIGSANPPSVTPGGAVLLVVAVTPGTNPTSAGITVTGNLSLIGGSATQRFYDDATNGDVTAGDNRFSYRATIPNGLQSGSKSITVTIADVQARNSTAPIQLTVTDTAPTNDAQIVFPHIADGGGYKSVLLLTNSTSTSTTATITFTSSTGSPLQVTIDGVSSTSFTVEIPARGAAKLTTSGTPASAATGWAKVTTSPEVELNGNAIFQYFSGSNLFCEASVPAAAPVSSVDFYADEEGGFITAFAMANPTSLTAQGTLTLRSKAGTTFGTYPFSLPIQRQTAVFLYQVLSGAPSGRAQIDLTNGYVSVTALRFHTSGIFSTVSVGYPGYSPSETAALFSPNGGVRDRIISEINKAQSTIDIAIYSFTADEIRDALVSARNRGVQIRIIADTSQANGQGSEIAFLEQHGFQLKRSSGGSGGLMHNKYMIIDGRLLLTGSYNWSASAEDSNYENAVFIQASSVIQNYIADFQKLWQR